MTRGRAGGTDMVDPDVPRWPDVLLWLGRLASPGDRVQLDAGESRHLTRVLRRGVGERAVLADGAGGWLDAIVLEAHPARTELRVEGVRHAPTEPVTAIELGFPILRPSRTEWLIEKATELGVSRFVPLLTARAQAHGAKPLRWRRVARSAAMQSLRSIPPEVMEPTSIEEWSSGIGRDVLRIVATPGGTSLPDDAYPPCVALVVGPEGDLTGSELGALASAGFVGVHLGSRRLRAETAAIALVARVAACCE